MKRSTKTQARKAAPTRPQREPTCVDMATVMYQRLIGAVNAKIEAGEVNTTLLREAASVIRAASTIDGERRKARAAENKQLEKLSRPLVVSWFRTLDAEERRSIVREVSSIDDGGNILA